jgi:ABC-type sugar transport system substrate-binding protein
MSKSTLTRRALVASTAAMPAAAALGLPAVAQAAAEPDPIFAVIENIARPMRHTLQDAHTRKISKNPGR